VGIALAAESMSLSYDIPARPGEPAHVHYDLRFAFFADPAERPERNANPTRSPGSR
jgi:hypothetical protein